MFEAPIAEGLLFKVSHSGYFEDETKRILKEHEVGMLLEGAVFDRRLEKSRETAKEAVLLFEQENFAQAKTSARRIIEEIRKMSGEWRTIDHSPSLCDKFKTMVGSMYSFASIGGPHEGVNSKEETELILKSTVSLLFYCNSLIRNERVATAQL